MLVANLTSLDTCITITASNVDLTLNGFTISGPGGGSDGPTGIQAVGITEMVIKGPGVVTNFGRGIDFEGVDDSTVKGVTSTGNFFGFVVNRDFVTPGPGNVSKNNQFKENRSMGNAQHGFTLNGANNNEFKANVASNNGVHGILIFDGTGNTIRNNTALNNADFDLRDDNVNCDNNTWVDNVFDTANQACIQ